MKNIKFIISVALLSCIFFAAGCGGSPAPVAKYSFVPAPYETPPTNQTLTAEYIEIALAIDGTALEVEEAWTNAAPLTMKIGEINEVTFKAAYDDNNVYILAQWKDESMDIGGKQWETREATGWKSGTSLPKQDMLSLGFMATKVTDFEKTGCQVACHDNTYMATNTPGEFIDVWTWMSAESGILGYANNYTVGSINKNIDPKIDGFEPTASYVYSAGSLYINKRNVRSPQYILKNGISPTLFPIGDIEQMVLSPEDPTKLPAGVKAPYYIKNPGIGCIDTQARYDETNKMWTLEMKRALVTDIPTQIQFAHKPEDGGIYVFGVSLFDNSSGVSHVYTTEAVSLEFSGK